MADADKRTQTELCLDRCFCLCIAWVSAFPQKWMCSSLTLRTDSQRRPGSTIPSGTAHASEWSGDTDVSRHATVHQAISDMCKDDM